VGEFMSVQVWLNQQGKTFINATTQYMPESAAGLWARLAVADFDHDGDPDFIAGNHGLNSQLRASREEPLRLWYKDFDNNGSVDPILVFYNQHKPYPFPNRDDMLDQLYMLRRRFTSYKSYAKASWEDVFTAEERGGAQELQVNELETVYFENRDGKFIQHRLPREAQYAPVMAIAVQDYNNDGHLDFILAGNQRSARIRVGAMDANFGQLYLGNGTGAFTYVPQAQSGLMFRGDVRSMTWILINGRPTLLAGIHQQGVMAYQKVKP